MRPGELLDALMTDIKHVKLPMSVRVAVTWDYGSRIVFDLRSLTAGGKMRHHSRMFRESDLQYTHMTPEQMSLELLNAAYRAWEPELFESRGKVVRP